jgi:SAM-dependent MidA family methyltransferase
MSQLREIIGKQVTRQGAIPFETFMELALYCPELGYYERPTASIGRRGDFITSVSIGSVFGELLAFQFADWLESIPGRVQLVEAGAHDGRLAGDVLEHLRAFRPEIFARTELWLVEPSPKRRAAQAATLAAFGEHVRWFNGWEELPQRVSGVIFSNELLDAFPVRRLGWDAQRRAWFEWGVTLENGRFTWAKMGPANDSAAPLELLREGGVELTDALLDVLPDSFTVECCPQALAWWRTAARALARGRLITIDYGLEALDFLKPERARGTLLAYANQHLADDPLASPGEQDLTAHVNFTAVRAAGEVEGLATESCDLQTRFLTRIAERTWNGTVRFESWTPARLRQFQTLTHPEHLGRPFRVLVQNR